ncbi:MAG: hypothetical protein HKO01_02450 [Flaviramulus sp.]|nr:hypothetical protein [Flaviramulus sp.]NNC49378.1 hypothetical protein [Flaviramulus sp.]
MTIQNKRIIASVLFVLISVVCVGQTPPPPLPPPPPGFPIDGGVIYGIILALIYGAKKLLFQNKS